MKKTERTPAEQGEPTYKVGNKRPPKNRQFGQPEGNPRHNGSWRKEDTPRYKLERLMTMTRDELAEIINNDNAPEFERGMADIIIQVRCGDVDKDGIDRPAAQRFQAIEKMINQVYGQPAQTNVNLNAEADEKEKAGFIKGFFIPGGEDDITGASREG